MKNIMKIGVSVLMLLGTMFFAVSAMATNIDVELDGFYTVNLWVNDLNGWARYWPMPVGAPQTISVIGNTFGLNFLDAEGDNAYALFSLAVDGTVTSTGWGIGGDPNVAGSPLATLVDNTTSPVRIIFTNIPESIDVALDGFYTVNLWVNDLNGWARYWPMPVGAPQTISVIGNTFGLNFLDAEGDNAYALFNLAGDGTVTSTGWGIGGDPNSIGEPPVVVVVDNTTSPVRIIFAVPHSIDVALDGFYTVNLWVNDLSGWARYWPMPTDETPMGISVIGNTFGLNFLDPDGDNAYALFSMAGDGTVTSTGWGIGGDPNDGLGIAVTVDNLASPVLITLAADLLVLCENIGEVVDVTVPTTAIYKNHGAYVSKVAHAADDELDLYPYLTEEQREEVHSCVVSARAKSNVGKRIE